jgi:hypothetical protein
MTRPTTWLIALLALSGSGCAALSAQRARTRVLETEVGGYRYRQPVEAVWPQLKKLLVDTGLTLGGKDIPEADQATGLVGLVVGMTSGAKETSSTPRGGLLLETGWTNGGRRWRAEAWPDGDGCRATLTMIAGSPASGGPEDWSARDYPLELELIRRVDPDGAARIDDLLDPPATPRAAATAVTPAPTPTTPDAPAGFEPWKKD